MRSPSPLRTRLLAALLLALAAATTALGAQDVRGQIQPNNELPELALLGSNVRVFLRHIPLPPMPSDLTLSPDSALGAAAAAAAVASSDDAASPPPAQPADGAETTPPKPPVQLSIPPAVQIAQKARTYVKQGEVPADRTTWLKNDGSFIFKSVATGSYVLEIISRTNEFAKYRVDVPDESTRLSPRIRVYTPGSSLSYLLLQPGSTLLLHPLIVHSTRRLDFFTTPQPFNLSSMLGMGGPMLILAVVGIVLVFFLPKLSAMLDPDAQRDLAESQKAMQRRMDAVRTGDINGLLYKNEEYEKATLAEKKRAEERARVNEGPKRRR